MSYKLFLLEKELGYQITADTNGLVLMQRLRMLDRYWKDKEEAYKEAEKDNNKPNNKSNLMK